MYNMFFLYRNSKMINQPEYNEAHLEAQIEARANGFIINADYSDWIEILLAYDRVLTLFYYIIEKYGEDFINAITINSSSWFQLMHQARLIVHFCEVRKTKILISISSSCTH